MTIIIKTILRKIARQILQFYPREYGKYSILQRVYFPYLAPKASDTKPVTVTMRDGFSMNLAPTELLQAHLYLFGTYELPTTNFVRRVLKSGNIVVDIGANIGYMTLFCSKYVGSQGKIYALEPEQRNYRALQDNIQINSITNVIPLQLAATAEETTLKLYLASDNHGAHSTIFNESRLTTTFEEIQGKPLDSIALAENITTIDLVKIDVEGAEYEVIQGMDTILKHQRPILVIELNHELQHGRGLTVEEFKSSMAERWNYRAFSILESGMLVEATQSYGFENGIFLPTEKLSTFAHVISS